MRTILVLSLLATGCTPAYLKAASRYADDGREQLKALAPAETLSGDLCFTRARLDLLRHRLGDKAEAWGSKPAFSAWMNEHRCEDGRCWRDRCAAQRAGDKVLHEATSLLGQYLAQLKGVAEGELPLGASPSLVAKGLAGAVGQLHAGLISETAKELEGPLTDAVDLMLKQYNAHELKPFLKDGDPVVQRLVASLQRYIDGVDAQRIEVEQMEGEVVDLLEVPLAKPSDLEPARTIAFVQFTQNVDTQLRTNARAVQSYRETLQQLSAAHAALTREALGVSDAPPAQPPPPAAR